MIYEFTREAVEFLFDAGCPLVILACNTASARALRTLQQRHLPARRPDHRILGVVRPSAEALAGLPPEAPPGAVARESATGTVAVLGTTGTIASDSYRIELAKLAPGLRLVQQACPLLVPLVEEGELSGPGTDYFLHKYLDPILAATAPPERILLACTHYPLLVTSIRAVVDDPAIELLDQGEIVASRLARWLARHPEMTTRLTQTGARRYATTDDPEWFAARAAGLPRPRDRRRKSAPALCRLTRPGRGFAPASGGRSGSLGQIDSSFRVAASLTETAPYVRRVVLDGIVATSGALLMTIKNSRGSANGKRNGNGKSAKTSPARSSARATVSGPRASRRFRRRRPRREDGRNRGARGRDAIQREQARRVRPRVSRPTSPARRSALRDPRATGSTLTESAASPKVGAGQPRLGFNPGTLPLDRVRADSIGTAPHHQSGRSRRRQPELAQGGPARAGAARRLHPAREDHPLRSRAHSGAHRPRARLGGARLLRVLQADDRGHPRLDLRRGRQAHAGVRPLLDGDRRARLGRHRARRARLRREVLHRRGQLGSGRQQHPGLLHPGRDEVSRPHPRRQARTALRHAAGGDGARHLLGFRVADARVDPHADVGDVRSRAAAQLSHDAGLRRAHLPPGERSAASRRS